MNTSLWVIVEIVHYLSFTSALLHDHGAFSVKPKVVKQVWVHDVDGAIDGNEYHLYQAVFVGREIHFDVTLLFRHEIGTCTLSELSLDGCWVRMGVIQDAHVSIPIHNVQHVIYW